MLQVFQDPDVTGSVPLPPILETSRDLDMTSSSTSTASNASTPFTGPLGRRAPVTSPPVASKPSASPMAVAASPIAAAPVAKTAPPQSDIFDPFDIAQRNSMNSMFSESNLPGAKFLYDDEVPSLGLFNCYGTSGLTFFLFPFQLPFDLAEILATGEGSIELGERFLHVEPPIIKTSKLFSCPALSWLFCCLQISLCLCSCYGAWTQCQHGDCWRSGRWSR